MRRSKEFVSQIPSLLLHDVFLHSFADHLLGHGTLHGFANATLFGTRVGFGGTERIWSTGRVKIPSVALFHCNVVAFGQGQKEKFVPVGAHVIHDDGKIPKPCEDLLTNIGVHFVDSRTQSWTKTSLQQGDLLKITKSKQDLGIEECTGPTARDFFSEIRSTKQNLLKTQLLKRYFFWKIRGTKQRKQTKLTH